ncbi:DNA binding protein [Pseudomonas fluorescens]|uniref:histone-like nucleoid-structuring protein, MvaT/MvaU family n=1 Tax=Pseudomonas fluorescens TaxID=294 RepID=UPI0035264150
MSRLAEFRAAEKALQEQLKQLESLKNDAGLKKEIEFEEKLQALMKTYGKGLRDIIAILDPSPRSGSQQAAAPKTRRARVVKVYQNPHTGELIETKGGNHRGLKAWKEQYGASTVDSWVRR